MEAGDRATVPDGTVDPREALGERLFGSLIATAEMYTVYLGLELGLYEALAEHGPLTVDDLAQRTGVAERYVHEWAEQQAVAGLITADTTEHPVRRRYHLEAEHAEVLVDPESPYYMAGAALFVAGCARALRLVPDAFRNGDGVAYSAYGTEVRDGIAAFNRPAFLHELGSAWLPSVPAIHERLATARHARVLDLGCGKGTSSIAMARAYPHVQVVGIDLDHASVLDARGAAEAEGLADRVTFHHGDAARLAAGDGFDLITVFEALHDMGDPVGTLRAARRMLVEGGSVLVADERVAESFTAPGDDLERLNYAFSVVHCLPATMAEGPVEANGTVLRSRTVRRWAEEAGFARCEELSIDFAFWRFYRLAG